MAVTTSSSLPAPVQQSFNLKLLSVPVPNMIHKIPAMEEMMPRNGGTTMRFRRYNPLTTALVPLGNSGVTPPSVNLTALDIDAKIDWYGQWVEINEQVVLQNQESVLNQAALRLGVSLRQTEDELVRNMLASTASQINCINGTNGDNPTNITLPDISRMTALLLSNNGYMFTSSIEGEDKFGTAPVRNAYIALTSTALTNNLNQVQNFIPQSNYPSQQRVLESEWGAVNNVRFLVSSIGSVTLNASALGANVYNVITCAKEAYACIRQDGASAQFIYRPAYLSGPLAQNVTVGWKMAEVPRILNDAWLGNLRCTLL
jgi:N4-gp56 family major capsid protein